MPEKGQVRHLPFFDKNRLNKQWGNRLILIDALDRLREYRRNRMNYYAVLGLQARVHLWLGERDEALRYARLACADLLKVDNELATVQAYSNLSMVFMECGDLAAADTCLHRSMASAVRMGDANMQLRNLGYMLHLKDLEHKPDSVDYYMKQARRLVPQVEATNTLAGYYQTERDALVRFLQSL